MKINEKLDLEKLRKAACITQEMMADHLGVTQAQVSKYEKEPDEVTHKVIVKWVEFCGYISNSRGLELHNPYIKMNEQISFLEDYSKYQPNMEQVSDIRKFDSPVNFNTFINNLKRVASKPRLGVLGLFDAGKSRMCNVLLGGDYLPSSYQPTTSIICLIRHINDKPAWQAEDVWVMKEGFDLNKINDKQHCLDHKNFAGGYEALKEFGTHSENDKNVPDKEGVAKNSAAVVYVNASILEACDILDLPGYNHSDEDQEKVELSQKMVDVILYLSSTHGFLGASDLNYLKVLTSYLPKYTEEQPFRNLMVVATRADLVGDQIDDVINKGSRRTFDHLDISDKFDLEKIEESRRHFRSRFFSFSADDPSIRSRFEEDLKFMLTEFIPKNIFHTIDRFISENKNETFKICSNWIDTLSEALESNEEFKTKYERLKSQDPIRIADNISKKNKIESLIDSCKEDCNKFISKDFNERIEVENIESMIKNRYESKKEAKELACSYLLGRIQNSVSAKVEEKSRDFAKEVEIFLDGFNSPLDLKTDNTAFHFNARGVFMGAVAGLGTFGALAAWASIAAAGSNLGAYLLIPTVVSFLSGLGISVGGTSAAISMVAFLGGPITIGIAIAIGASLVAGRLLGDSWQKTLAKKIHKILVKNNVEQKIVESVDGYWRDTKKGFVEAFDKTEEAYQKNLETMKSLAEKLDPEEIKQEIEFAKKTKGFFASLPWKDIS